MNTTSVFVGLVVIGLHAFLWIGLIALAVMGFQGVHLENLLTINLALPLLALAYVLGILIDRVSDILFAAQDLRLREKQKSGDLPPLFDDALFCLEQIQ